MNQSDYEKLLRLIHKEHYAFRGALCRVIIEFFKDFPEFDAEQFRQDCWSLQKEKRFLDESRIQDCKLGK